MDFNSGICRMGYKYDVWDGSQFHSKMLMLQSGPLFQKYFPDYQEFLVSREKLDREKKLQAMIKEYLERLEGGME